MLKSRLSTKVYNFKSFIKMNPLKTIWVVLILANFTMIKIYAVPITLNEAQGGLSPSDPAAKTSNDSRLSHS